MIDSLTRRGVKMKWLGCVPGGTRKPALVVPFYNEGKENFENRLRYFNNLAREFGEYFEVILINDGSTDNSLERIQEFLKHNAVSFFISSVYPNARKVGAIFLTILSISNEIVVLSDFDTDMAGLETLIEESGRLLKHPSMMGCYFRMLPFEGTGKVFLFQQLEYSLARILYKIHGGERSVRVMPGAGSCYKRAVLISIYHEHSGLLNGEDREATLIGLKKGYKVFYNNTILSLTRPPLSLKNLIRQRIRWNLGYLETFFNESRYYGGQMASFTSLGILTIVDMVAVLFTLLSPFLIAWMSFADASILMKVFGIGYLASVLWCFSSMLISPKESREFSSRRLYSVIIFPAYKMVVEYVAWMGAFSAFIKARCRSDFPPSKIKQQQG